MSNKEANNKKRITLRVDFELFDKMKPILEDEDRSINLYIVQLIKQDLKRRGIE